MTSNSVKWMLVGMVLLAGVLLAWDLVGMAVQGMVTIRDDLADAMREFYDLSGSSSSSVRDEDLALGPFPPPPIKHTSLYHTHMQDMPPLHGPDPLFSYGLSTEEFLDITASMLLATEARNRAPRDRLAWHTHVSSSPKWGVLEPLKTVAMSFNACTEMPLPAGSRRLRIAVVCGMHAREPFSSELCRSWMLLSTMALDNSNDECLDLTMRQYVAPIDWLFVPVANPRGRDRVAASWKWNDMRPDTRASTKAVRDQNLCWRGNDRGVDLNRNWLTDLPSKRRVPHRLEDRTPEPEEEAGPEAFSEAETINLRNLLQQFSPDLLLSVHTGTNGLFIPWDNKLEVAPQQELLFEMVNWLAGTVRCRKDSGCTAGPGAMHLGVCKGTMGDYAYAHGLAAFPVTMEVYRGPEWPDAPRLKVDNVDDTRYCFDYFNPSPFTATYGSEVADALARWRPLWGALHYLSLDRYQWFTQLVRAQAITLQ